MENQRYMQDGVDLKRMFLLFKEKIILVIIAVMAGALLGGGIYLLYHLVLAPEREYQSVSKLYLNFNCEPEDYNQLAYNGYTWNDLMITDPILDYTMKELGTGVERDTVVAATKAEILSDIRLLTITITAKEPELAARIMEATQKALVHLGETDELFHSIEVYSTSQPQQIVWDNRTLRAVITGAVIALVAALMWFAFYYVLDDSVYVEGDVQKRYGIPVLGVFTRSKQGSVQSYHKDFKVNYDYLCENKKSVALISADVKEDAQAIAEVINQSEEQENTDGKAGRTLVCVYDVCGADEHVYEKMRYTDGIILVLRYGSRNGKRVERMLYQLEKQDCPVFGMIITGADEEFLKLYYLGKDVLKKVMSKRA